MSSVELATAVVPLLIALIEDQSSVWHKPRASGKLRSKDEQQLGFFQELHAELSLLDVVLDNIKAASNSLEFKESQTQQCSDVLGNNATRFHQILDRVLKSISHLIRGTSRTTTQDDKTDAFAVLNELKQIKSTLTFGASVAKIRARFRVSSNAKTRSVAITRIRDGNERLGRLLGISMATFNHGSEALHHETLDRRIRTFPTDLYAKVADKWSQTCSCPARHMAMLCLWDCCSPRDAAYDPCVSFHMIFSMPEKYSSATTWQETTFCIAESAGPANNVEDDSRFVSSQDDVEAQNMSQDSQKRDVDSESFCGLLHAAQSDHSSLRIAFDDGKLWQQRCIPACLDINAQLGTSLYELLGRSHGWRFREKCLLAVVLAYAVLHCGQGPWLRADWSKENIYFFKKGMAHEPDLSRPFLAVDFNNDSEDVAQTELYMAHSNRRLLSLGIVLLEVSEGLRIEDCWSDADLTDGRDLNENTSLTAALRLLEKSEGDLCIGYRKAIKACLEWDTINFDDDEGKDFAMRMYEHIVKPLEKQLEHGFDITPEHLRLTAPLGDSKGESLDFLSEPSYTILSSGTPYSRSETNDTDFTDEASILSVPLAKDMENIHPVHSTIDEKAHTMWSPATVDMQGTGDGEHVARANIESRLLTLRASLRDIIQTVPIADVRIECCNDSTLLNRCKAFVEDNTSVEWDWWPLSPRVPIVTRDNHRLKWKIAGQTFYEKISILESTQISTILAHTDGSPDNDGYRPEETATHTFTSTAERRYTPIGVTQGLPTDIAQGALQAGSPELPPQDNTNQNTADDNANILPAKSCSPSRCVVFGVKHASGMIDIENIKISSDTNDPSFFAELKRLEAKYRWPVLKWFSPFVFSYCKFVQFESINVDQVYCRGESLPEDYGHEAEYEYHPRPPTTRNPPLEKYEFQQYLRACTPRCLWKHWCTHRCCWAHSNSHKWKRIPRKKSEFITKDPGEIAFGLEAVYTLSFLVVFSYHVLSLLTWAGFCVWWLKQHLGDLQNATVPMTVFLGVVASFWILPGRCADI